VALIAMRRREQKRRRRAEELDAELEKAREVQLKLLPGGPMDVTGLKVFGLHQSMQSVGGDYYDFFALEDGRVMLCIADVAGHGLAAALLMSNLQATLRVIAQAGRKLTEIVALLNHEICQRTSPDRFVTLVLAEISADRSRVTLCNAGHNPAYIVRASGQIEEVESGGIMLGVMDMSIYIEVEHRLERGDTVVLYTDGIPEATYGINEMFGYQRMKYFLQDHRSDGLASVAQGLFRRVTPDEAHTIEDDMAIILARVVP
jgi:sigma-B regulation protein RsbU (phosphoserine phosphatase)